MIRFIVLIFVGSFIGNSVQNVGEPLILTKYLEKGDIEGGQSASKVPPLINGVESYAGYFTVDPKYNSNMFFWYFPADDPKAPVTVWLQGGPGGTSMYGLLFENGPLMLKGDKVVQRDYSWTKVSHMIYIDNPVGTGFSFTDSTAGYATDEVQVGNGLYSTILQFLTLFPHLQQNELFITGESYAGKYVPAMAYTIHQNNPTAKFQINLKGLAMGDGLCDPINMLGYGDYLYQIGLVDEGIREKFQTAEAYIKKLIEEGKYDEATSGWNSFVGGGSIMANVTGIDTYYNYYNAVSDQADMDNMETYLQQDWIRQRIHVGNTSFSSISMIVNQYLSTDMLKTIVPWLKVLAENYHVMVYNGQLDIIVAYPLTVNFLRNFEWCGYDDYLKTPRKIWMVNDQLAGYSRTVKPINCKGSLTELLVRNAGHMVPHDQPAWAFDIITKLVKHEDF